MASFHISGVTAIQSDMRLFCFEFARGHAKSTVFSLFLPIYQTLKGLTKNLLLVSKNKDNAMDLLLDIQAEFEENELLINDYGEFISKGSWTKSKFDINQGAHFACIGREQSPRGTKWQGIRVDTIICDDIDDPELSRSNKRLKIAFNWFKEDLCQTVDITKPHKIILVGNRYSQNMILSKFAYGDEIAQPIAEFHIRVNALDENGEPSWKERFKKEDFDKIRQSFGSISFQREYMNKPIAEGNIFKQEWIQYKPIYALKDYDLIVTYFDPSRGSEKADYKAIVTVGYKNLEYHILSIFLRRTEMLTCIYYIFDLWERQLQEKANQMIFMESTFQQADIFKILLQKIEQERNTKLPIKYDDSRKTNKIARIESMTPYFELGNVSFNIDNKDNKDFKLAMEQLLGFEVDSENDDFCDALHGSIENISGRISLITPSYVTGRYEHKRW
jgi:predicted phage terminase large subunit-like protein